MIYNEGMARRDGEILPIECIRIRLSRPGSHAGNMHYHDYTELLFGLSGTAQGTRTMSPLRESRANTSWSSFSRSC